MRTCVRVRCALARKNFIFIYSYYINVSCAVSYLVPLAVSLAVSLTNAKSRADGRFAVSLAVSLAVPLAVSCAVSLMHPISCAADDEREIDRERVRPATGTNANVCGRERPRTRTCAASGRPADGLRGACAELLAFTACCAPSRLVARVRRRVCVRSVLVGVCVGFPLLCAVASGRPCSSSSSSSLGARFVVGY